MRTCGSLRVLPRSQSGNSFFLLSLVWHQFVPVSFPSLLVPIPPPSPPPPHHHHRSIRRNREWICRQSHKHAANAETKSFSAFYVCLFRILTQEFSRRAQKLMDWQYYSAVSGFNTPASVTSGGGGDANPSAKSLYVGDLDPAIDEATLTNMFSMCNDVCFFFLFLLLFVFKLFLLFFLRSFFL